MQHNRHYGVPAVPGDPDYCGGDLAHPPHWVGAAPGCAACAHDANPGKHQPDPCTVRPDCGAPWVLDLFCCAGGAARGYQRAGFRVMGVDIEPRPNYCGDAFLQADALEMLGMVSATDWAMIHASPPCQDGSTLTIANRAHGRGREHVQLLPRTRALLDGIGLPYVIEQPASRRGGLMRTDLRLCMDMFPIEPPRVFRHRDFELSSMSVPQPRHDKHRGRVRGWRHGVRHDGDYVAAYGSGGGKATVAEMQHALGIDWTDVREELTEAIPPAYTEHIGRAFLAQSLTQQGRLTA